MRSHKGRSPRVSRLGLTCIAAAAISIIVIPGSVSARSTAHAASCPQGTFVLRYVGIQAPNDPHTLAQIRFAKEIKRRSNGCVQARIYFFHQYANGNLTDVTDQTHLNIIQMVDTAPAQLTSYDPSLGVLTLPFMFKTEQKGLAALDGPGGRMLNSSLYNAGFKLLGWQLNGFRHLCTTRPVRKVSDLKGMRIRVIPSPVTQAVYSALGANPVGMNFSEVPTALTSGVIDGLDFPIVPAFGNQLWSYCKYYTLSATSFEVIATVMNRSEWEKLPAKYQTLVASAERNATLWQRKANMKVEVTGLAALKSHGMQVITLPASQQKLLRKLTYPVWTNWTKQYGSRVLNALLKGASR